MERFYARTFEVPEMVALWEHLDSCDDCHQVFQEIFQRRRQGAPLRINLSPEHWIKDEHFDYELLAAYIDKTLDSELREIVELHLKRCSDCRGDLAGLIAFRREIEPELKVRYGPEQQSGATPGWLLSLWNWPSSAWKPAYTLATLIIIGFAIVAVVFLIKPGTGNKTPARAFAGLTPTPSAAAFAAPALNDFERRVPRPLETGSTPKPDSTTSQARLTLPPPSAARKDEKRFHAYSPTEVVAMLNDGGRSITIDRAGNLTGLSDLSPEFQQSIREFLVAAEIKRPDILAEINGVNSSLRGTGEKPSFALRSPVGEAIAEDHPRFQWEPLNGATAYRVQVSDSPSRAPISSELLPATTTQWATIEALSRGKVYSWIVIAIVNGKEIVSPPVSMPEAKFKVLEEEKVRELSHLKRANSQLLLGVFCAREGMLAEAKQAFQSLADDNPQSPIVQKLPGLIKSWQVVR